ncbi:hypothetical protein BST81_08495 [Leptolyngbya sp. 'hensonii']|uniref:hypothetical protein n=1 Tax=Leptolyngbya sp. 'hensonii' TaxID=1922337 RepID=UPI00094F5199|nr:hypothetical protein [Leptolyngbya sp. 'hensonii']OLP18941.1 hypothetical protein BST81_08495 [Leptolyngbya sp. 'hensonii']
MKPGREETNDDSGSLVPPSLVPRLWLGTRDSGWEPETLAGNQMLWLGTRCWDVTLDEVMGTQAEPGREE